MSHEKKHKINTIRISAVAILLSLVVAGASASKIRSTNIEKTTDYGIPATLLVHPESKVTSPLSEINAIQVLNDGIPVSQEAFIREYENYKELKNNLKKLEQDLKKAVTSLNNPLLTSLIAPANMIDGLNYFSDHYVDNLNLEILLSFVGGNPISEEIFNEIKSESERIEQMIESFMAPIDKIIGNNPLWVHWRQLLCRSAMSIEKEVKLVDKNPDDPEAKSVVATVISLNYFFSKYPPIKKMFDFCKFYQMVKEIRLINANILARVDHRFSNNDKKWLLFKWSCLAGDICVIPKRYIIGDITGNRTAEIGEFRKNLEQYGNSELAELFDDICNTRILVELSVFKSEAFARTLWNQNWQSIGNEVIREFLKKQKNLSSQNYNFQKIATKPPPY